MRRYRHRTDRAPRAERPHHEELVVLEPQREHETRHDQYGEHCRNARIVELRWLDADHRGDQDQRVAAGADERHVDAQEASPLRRHHELARMLGVAHQRAHVAELPEVQVGRDQTGDERRQRDPVAGREMRRWIHGTDSSGGWGLGARRWPP